MDRQILNFTANEQILTVSNPIRISTNKVNYIEAHFSLGDNWSGYDSVRAVWYNDYKTIATVLDSLGRCIVPFEVLKVKNKVRVNLVGSIASGDVLTDRLTTYPAIALVVDDNAKADGDNTTPITPSQFEQFAAAVRTDADRAEAGATSAEASALAAGVSEAMAAASVAAARASELAAAESETNAATSEAVATEAAQSAEQDADRAEQAAADAGFMEFYINDAGHLIMEHTESVDNIDFRLVNGNLILEVS